MQGKPKPARFKFRATPEQIYRDLKRRFDAGDRRVHRHDLEDARKKAHITE